MKRELNLWQAVSIAIGSMIGASIFTIFGLGVSIAGRDLPEAFLLSGLFALIVGYSYSILSKKFVSNAGPIEYILKAFGDNSITGSLSILMWFSYIISIALFAKGFSEYFLPLFGFGITHTNIMITEVLLIFVFMLLSLVGSKVVGRAEEFLVIIKLLILFVFIVFGFMSIKKNYIFPVFGINNIHGLISASVIFFLSYMGFGLITNASENIKNPRKNVPLAIFISILIVITIYVLISLVAIGNLSIPELINANENVLAIAAMPFLGKLGFILISIGALFSISSALNATIYGGANIAYALAKDGELPEFFERKTWFNSREGLYITVGIALTFALLFNINSIAVITSAIYTIIYLFVLISHYKMIDEVGGNKKLVFFNIIILSIVFILLIQYQISNDIKGFYVIIFVVLGTLLMEYIFREVKNRIILSRVPIKIKKLKH
jgi:amino acid transporter